MKKSISDIFPVGGKVFFNSGNFIGYEGKIIDVDETSNLPGAIFGFIITVELDNGRIVKVEKTEHLKKI